MIIFDTQDFLNSIFRSFSLGRLTFLSKAGLHAKKSKYSRETETEILLLKEKFTFKLDLIYSQNAEHNNRSNKL